MREILLVYKSHFSKPEIFRFLRIRMTSMMCIFTVVFNFDFYSKAQTTQVIPDSNVSGTFLGPLANSARTYQMLIDDTQLTPFVGKYLSSISFRLLASATVAWPASDTTFSSYQIYLSDGVDPANRQLNFTANISGTQTMVRSGALVIPAGSLTSGGDPNAFSYNIMFDTPYLYSGGNLILEIRHTGSNGASASTHSVTSTNTAAGYGTLFSACWQGTGAVLNGNFAYLKLSSLDNLSVDSVKLPEASKIYPNPVKDHLYITSQNDIAEVFVLNLSGQKVFSSKYAEKKVELNVSFLLNGVYILQIIDKKGNVSSKKFVKE
ncbi:T9SS type A sorting domain-containing protein [Chryseobacterium foetidum]|uniref:T9SS type A sorting domain-containing protein n=1 Tax=Chryseobacterium foetidum TaxID=2951057 RepID=UPI0021C5AA78|nr:T9SS type A sorting domain-containing protein [Chryseobacterium foetidum]